MKDLEDWAAVHIVYKQTKSKRATARILGISRNTVKKLLEKKEAPEYHRTIYHSKIEPYKAVCFSLREDADAIYEAVQNLFDELGGVTLELLIDNPKALVIENNPKSEDEIRYNPHALLMAANLGTELNACPCYWPRKKGKVENPFTYIEQQFIKGNRFESMEELNRQWKDFVNDWCNEVHGTTKRVPNDFYLIEEKALLQPLPMHIPPKLHVDSDCICMMVSDGTAYLSVYNCIYF